MLMGAQSGMKVFLVTSSSYISWFISRWCKIQRIFLARATIATLNSFLSMIRRKNLFSLGPPHRATVWATSTRIDPGRFCQAVHSPQRRFGAQVAIASAGE